MYEYLGWWHVRIFSFTDVHIRHVKKLTKVIKKKVLDSLFIPKCILFHDYAPLPPKKKQASKTIFFEANIK